MDDRAKARQHRAKVSRSSASERDERANESEPPPRMAGRSRLSKDDRPSKSHCWTRESDERLNESEPPASMTDHSLFCREARAPEIRSSASESSSSLSGRDDRANESEPWGSATGASEGWHTPTGDFHARGLTVAACRGRAAYLFIEFWRTPEEAAALDLWSRTLDASKANSSLACSQLKE